MIGSDVKKVREYLDLSQQEMCKILGLTLSYYRTIEYTTTRQLHSIHVIRLREYIAKEHQELWQIAMIIDYMVRVE